MTTTVNRPRGTQNVVAHFRGDWEPKSTILRCQISYVDRGGKTTSHPYLDGTKCPCPFCGETMQYRRSYRGGRLPDELREIGGADRTYLECKDRHLIRIWIDHAGWWWWD